MPITFEAQESRSVIRVEGEFSVGVSGELKQRLVEWSAAGGDLHLDLAPADGADILLLQLLIAASREAARSGVTFTASVPQALCDAARDAGIAPFPATVAAS